MRNARLFAWAVTAALAGLLFGFDTVVISGFFCFMMCLQLFWVKLAVPETKGIPMEAMQRTLGIKIRTEPPAV